MGPSGKWIDGLSADCSVEDAARRSLDARLGAVVHWLPLAAHLAEHDIEHVHRLRVSTRRAIAALKLYRDWLPRKHFRWLKKRLKKIRRAAGEARDLDVLAERLARDYGDRAAPVVALIKEKRAAAQSAIHKVSERCRRDDRFIRRISRLLEGIRQHDEENAQPTPFRRWAVSQLAAATTPFFDSLPDDGSDAAALHQFRIKTKALRYTIELVESAFGRELRDEHYPVVEKLQERLGRIQDHVAASQLLSQWSEDSKDTDLQGLLRELAAEEYLRLDEATGEFRSWWTDEKVDALRRGLPTAADREPTTPSPQAAHQT
jgi:CHAD domain-containing protein